MSDTIGNRKTITQITKMFWWAEEDVNDPRNRTAELIGDDMPKELPKITPQTAPTINQRANRATNMYCTRVSAYKAIYHNLERGGELTNEYLIDKAQKEHSRWTYTIGKGDSTLNWVKNAIKDWNEENPDQKMFYLVEAIWSPTFREALKKWYMIVFSYIGKNSYHSDINTDGKIDQENHEWSRIYGHASNQVLPHAVHDTDTRMDAKKDYPDKALVIDQFYQARKDNSYVLNIDDIGKLVANRTFYRNSYIILPEKALKPWLSIEDVSKLAKGKKIALVSQNAVSIARNYFNDPKAKKEAGEYAKAVDSNFGNLRGKTEAEKAILTLKWSLSFAREHLDEKGKALAEQLSLQINKTWIVID